MSRLATRSAFPYATTLPSGCRTPCARQHPPSPTQSGGRAWRRRSAGRGAAPAPGSSGAPLRSCPEPDAPAEAPRRCSLLGLSGQEIGGYAPRGTASAALGQTGDSPPASLKRRRFAPPRPAVQPPAKLRSLGPHPTLPRLPT